MAEVNGNMEVAPNYASNSGSGYASSKPRILQIKTGQPAVSDGPVQRVVPVQPSGPLVEESGLVGRGVSPVRVASIAPMHATPASFYNEGVGVGGRIPPVVPTKPPSPGVQDGVNRREKPTLSPKTTGGVKVGDIVVPGYKGADAISVIIQTDEDDHSFHLDETALASVLLRPDIADKKVAVISVAGAFRKGKSFLLNFFLRYLQSKASNHTGPWVGDEDDVVDGFSWRGGSERDTSGILLWKDPFLIKMPTGEEIVVLLMDTQGAFDSQSTVKDCATVFALSTMISSLQIYNLSQNIQEDDLQHLQLFTEYGRLALEDDSTSKPFQSLLFLVRDWSFPYEAEYGFEGGERILERRLQLSEKQHTELQQLRKHIKSCFQRIECFLMPHPGLCVATSPAFMGQLSEVEGEFKSCIQRLVPRLLAPETLTLKELNGNKITCRQLVDLFQAYIKIFQGEELPEPKSMLLATAEANNLAAVTSSRAHYSKCMDEICGGDTPYLNQTDLEHFHCRYREQSLQNFVDIRKMGGEEFSETFLERLDTEIMDQFENYVKMNNSKNLFRSVKTPAVLFVVLIVDYLIKEILEVMYLDIFARIFSSFLGIILLTISLWGYIRYSGNMRELGQTIDEVANTIWDNILNPLSSYAMTEGVKKVTNLQRTMSQTSEGFGGHRFPTPSSKKIQ